MIRRCGNFHNPSFIPFFSQHLLQPDHKGLQLFPIIHSVVDVPAELPDVISHATIHFLHISPHR